MNRIIGIFIVASVMGQTAFAHILPRQVDSARAFIAAFEGNRKIQDYVQGRSPATAAVFAEILKFADELESRRPGVNDKMNELFALLEEVGNQLPSLNTRSRQVVQPFMNSLLNKYSRRSKSLVLMRLFDRFWLWSPENLDFMASMVRNDYSPVISTQLLWILERATVEERARFFSQVPEKQTNQGLRWFPFALALKYGRPVDARHLKRLMNSLKPETLRPDPRSITLNGTALATTEDLYFETKAKLQELSLNENCADTMVIEASENEEFVN